MTIEESLQGVTRLFLDSAPVIYAVEQNLQYLPLVRVVFERIEDGLVKPLSLCQLLTNI